MFTLYCNFQVDAYNSKKYDFRVKQWFVNHSLCLYHLKLVLSACLSMDSFDLVLKCKTIRIDLWLWFCKHFAGLLTYSVVIPILYFYIYDLWVLSFWIWYQKRVAEWSMKAIYTPKKVFTPSKFENLLLVSRIPKCIVFVRFTLCNHIFKHLISLQSVLLILTTDDNHSE